MKYLKQSLENTVEIDIIRIKLIQGKIPLVTIIR